MSRRGLAVFFVVLLGAGLAVAADDNASSSPAASGEADMSKPLAPPGNPAHAHPSTAAQSATDPSAILFQWQNFYQVGHNSDGDVTSGSYTLQPVIPTTKNSLLRPALTYTSTPSGTNGISDLLLLQPFFFNPKGSTFGIGPVATLPTASEDALGSGKYQLGFVFAYLNKTFKKDLEGILFWNQWSVAGDDDRSDVNKFNYQIVWIHHFKWGYIGWTDVVGSIDWENDNHYTFPAGIRIGKVYKAKHPVNIAVEPYYVYEEIGDNSYGIKFTANFIMSSWMKHDKKKK